MFDRAQLAAFVAVLETGGFATAAQVLSITQSAITQRVKALEEETGQMLLLRQRPARPTRAGAALLRYARQLELLDQGLDAALTSGSAGRAVCSIAVNSDSLATWFTDAWERIARECGILLQVLVEDQEHTARLLADGTVSGVVTSAEAPLQGCTARRLGIMDYVCVAGNDFYARHFADKPIKLALREAPAIRFNAKDFIHSGFVWKHFRIGADEMPMHDIPSPVTLLDGVRRDLAYAFVPELQARPLLDSGTLVEIFPGKKASVPLFWHEWTMDHTVLQQVGKRVLAAAKASLRQ
ncbi:LysR family transcriptional regulator ArgP [Paraburkholderia edwinii]|uniref:LysR family transcriptional regulator ArgP n=1 Tax=Paraburkholderia edwinii TaxID=2861782 RepID=A0ABX8UW83_9BURK|nr:LysR family transcriptional regulator ArgP [Paraburkholderia edwinii]QYD73258.1 LysR family transcriptional regulator ArgP [Paraburkholderia edwinii]